MTGNMCNDPNCVDCPHTLEDEELPTIYSTIVDMWIELKAEEPWSSKKLVGIS